MCLLLFRAADTILRSRLLAICVCLIALAFGVVPVHSQISFTSGAGLTQSQNFNSIGNSATATLPANWRIGGATATTFALAGTAVTRAAGTTGVGVLNGTSGGGSYNFANGVTASSTDRALGFLSSGGFPAPYYLYAETQNNSGMGVTSLQVQYNIEKYRSGAREWTITFLTSTDGSTWTSHALGTDVFPIDANNTTVSNPPAATAKNFTITGLTIPIGGTLYVGWSCVGTGGTTNGQGLGIDDVVLTAVNGVLPGSAAYSGSDFPEAVANNGTITQTRTITLTNAQWLNSIPIGNQLTPTTHFTTANVPPGMTLTVTKNSNTQVTLALTGTATNNAVVNNINNLTITFQDAAIQGGVPAASTITGLNRNDLTVSYINPPSRIRAVQGAAHVSPVVGTLVVTVPGIVTAVRTDGFYIQDPTDDGDVRTSEGILIYTNTAPAGTIAVGDSVHVTGTVVEFRSPNPEGLSITEIANPGLVIVEQTAPSMTIVPTIIGSGGRIPPSNVISDDAVSGDAENGGTLFDPANDGLDFYESLEGMLVRVNNAVVVGDTPVIIVDNGANATGVTTRGGIANSALDDNPERLDLIRNSTALATPGNRQVGDRYPGIIEGILDYTSGRYRIRYTQALPAVVPSVLTPEVTALTGDANRLTVASFNAYNMNPASAHIPAFAGQIVNGLRSPDIIGLQEIQDNSGATNNGIVDASTTLNTLITAIQTAGGPTYQFRQINPTDGAEGGAPGANIRVAFLFNPARVQFTDRGTPGALIPTFPQVDGTGKAELSISPGRVDPSNVAWASTRRPLAGEFVFNGNKVFVINAHLSSKIGDEPSFGRNQPPVLGSEVNRIQQGASINAFVNSLLGVDPTANVIVIGDMNEHDFRPPMTVMAGSSLINLISTIPINDRYTYNFEGNSQILDNILVCNRLRNFYQSEVDIVHLNADLHSSAQVSDHDAVVSRIDFTPPVVSPVSGSVVSNSGITQGPRIDSFSPQYGLTGTVVTILGAGFTGTQRVLFGSAQATSFQVVSDNLIYATVGAGASGAISVITPQNTLTINGFIFGTPPLPPPTISNVTPSNVFPGDTLFVSGQFLERVSNVSIGGQSMNFTLLNGQIRVIIGAVPSGQRTLLFGTATGTSSAFSIFVQELPEARIFRLSASSIQAGEQSYTIKAEGINLARIQLVSIFDGTSATAAMVLRSGISFPTNTAFSFSIPPTIQTAGIKNLQFLNANGVIISVTLAVIAAPAPLFANSVFSTSANSSAFTVRLQGTGFMRSASILLNGTVPLRGFVESSTAVVVEIPRELNTFEEIHTIQIINTDKQSTQSTVRVGRGNLPYITRVSTRFIGTEFILTITGLHFSPRIFGLLGLTPLRIITADSTVISVSISASALASYANKNILLYLVNPNNTSIGLWLPISLFDDARNESVVLASSFLTPDVHHELRGIAGTNASYPTYQELLEREKLSIAVVQSKILFDKRNRMSEGMIGQKFVVVFPNPAHSFVSLALPSENTSERYTIRIENMLGETVLSTQVYGDGSSQAGNRITLDISTLPTGSYYLQVQGSNKIIGTPFLIVR